MRGSIRSVLFAFAAVGCMLAVGGSTAMGASILEAKGGLEKPLVFIPLRDDLTTPPSNAQYGADILAQNTRSALVWTVGGVLQNKNPTNYVFAGIKLHSNPTAVNCSVATAYAEFVDLQLGVNGAGANSPVYADTLNAPWRIDINSGLCTTNPGKVTITGVGLFFPNLGPVEARGTITGLYEQPGANCAAGGVKFDLVQPGLVLSSGGTAGFSNGAGGNFFLCFVASNNYVYPTVGKEIGPLTGEIKKT